jgi:hypothetical protein
MRSLGTQDPIECALADLTPLEPDPSRAEAVRRRCRTQLARRTAGVRRPDTVGRSWTRIVAPVTLGIFSAFYAVELLIATLRIEGWLR